MSFTSKKLQQKKSGLGFIKGATLFFLGMSCILFMARAFDIVPIAPNAIMYISQIFLTASGDNQSATGISLDGINGNAYFAGKVGIGTNTPSKQLEVVGGAKIDGTTFNVDEVNHRVGIGTATPTCGLANVCGFHVNGKDTYLDGDTSMVNGDVGIGYDVGNFAGGGNLYVINNVGIGTTGPTEKLEVDGNIKFTDEYTWIGSTTNQLYFGHQGNMGIGTTGPTERLVVNGNIKLSEGGNREITVAPRTTDGNGNNLFIKGGTAYTTFASYNGGRVTIEGGDNVGPILCMLGVFCPTIGSILLNPNGGGGVLIGDGGRNAGRELEVNGNVRLTTNGFIEAGNNTNQLFLKNDGNVGINTNNPTEKLEVKGDDGESILIGSWTGGNLLNDSIPRIQSTTLNFGAPGLHIQSTASAMLLEAGSYAGAGVPGGYIYLKVPQTVAVPPAPPLVGSVGIGTTSPIAMLTVAGGIKPISITDRTNPCTSVYYPKGTEYYNSYYDKYCYCSSGNIARPIDNNGVPTAICYYDGINPETEEASVVVAVSN